MKYVHPKKKLEIKPRLTFFTDGAAQSYVDAVIVSTGCPPSLHLTSLPLSSNVEDHAHSLIHISHPPNITSLNFRADSVVSP